MDVLFLIVMGFASFVQTIAGFAGNLLAMPVGIMAMGADTARVVVNMLSWLSCMFIVVREYQQVQWRELIHIVIYMGVGLLSGTVIAHYFWSDSFLIYYGLFVMGVGIKNLFIKKEVTLSQGMGIATLVGAGLIHSLYLSGGTLLVIYAVKKFPEKNQFRVSLAAIWVLLDCLIFATQWQQGLLTLEAVKLSAMALLPAVAGVYLGYRFHTRIDKERFFKLVNIILVLSGLILICSV